MDIDYVFNESSACAPLVLNLDKLSNENYNFRNVIWTGCHQQLVLMAVTDSIPMEVHPTTDQFIHISRGTGYAILDNVRYPLAPGSAIAIPAGTHHGIYNDNSTVPLQLYSVYAPPHHPHGLLQETRPIE